MYCRLAGPRPPVFLVGDDGGASFLPVDRDVVFFVFLVAATCSSSSSEEDEGEDDPELPDDEELPDESESLVYLVFPFDNGRSNANVTLGLAGLATFLLFVSVADAFLPLFFVVLIRVCVCAYVCQHRINQLSVSPVEIRLNNTDF